MARYVTSEVPSTTLENTQRWLREEFAQVRNSTEDIYASLAFSILTFVNAGYGAISLATPTLMGTIGAGFNTVPMDSENISDPRNVTHDLASEGLHIDDEGIWRITAMLSLSHDELNAGRTIFVRLWNETEAVALVTIPVGIGRNIGVTTWTGTFLVEFPAALVGDTIQLQIGGGNVVLATTAEFASLNCNNCGEFRGEFQLDSQQKKSRF